MQQAIDPTMEQPREQAVEPTIEPATDLAGTQDHTQDPPADRATGLVADQDQGPDLTTNRAMLHSPSTAVAATVRANASDRRRFFVGGSDARIIMGSDESALIRLWREKRGELEPEDLSGNLIVQLGIATEALNRQWYERNTGNSIKSVQKHVRHRILRWMGATLDGLIERPGVPAEVKDVNAANVVFEAKFMLPWSFSEAAAAEKYMPQLQHNMFVCHCRHAVLSIITGGGKWVEIAVAADPLYQHLLLTAEKKFWRAIETGEPPRLFTVEPPRPRLEAIRIIDMASSNGWAEFAALFRDTRAAFFDHERAKAELKALMPEDAKEAIGHGIRAKRSKSGAVSFDVLETEVADAALQ